MNKKAILLLFAVFATTAVDAQKKLVCYWFGKMDIGEINPHICTHIVYSFLGVDSYGNLNHIYRSEWEALQYIERIVALRNQRPDLKVIAAVGGYNEPMQPHWSAMAANPEARGNFARNVLDFIRSTNLNGIDIDWEYPNLDGSAPHDKGNFILLLQDLKQTLGHDCSLSVAIGAGEWRTSMSYNIPEIFAICDFVNVMTYDMHGAWEGTAGIHAPLFRSALDNTPANVHDSVDFLMHSGAHRDKLIVGIPSYGIAFNLADANQNGVGAPVTGGEGDFDYRDICQRTRSGALVYRWEETQRVPYAFSGNFWIGYDDVRSVIEKAHYIRNHNYGGGMFWALDDDDYGNACGEGRFPLIANVYNIVMA